MLLHKNQNTSSKTIEFHEVHRRAPKPPLVPKFNLGTRDGEPNDINYLQHHPLHKIRIPHKIRTKKSVQYRKKSTKIISKSFAIPPFFSSMNNPCLFGTVVPSEARHRFGCLTASAWISKTKSSTLCSREFLDLHVRSDQGYKGARQ